MVSLWGCAAVHVCVCVCVCVYVCVCVVERERAGMCVCLCDMTHLHVRGLSDTGGGEGMATTSGLLRIIGLFCKRAL